MLFLNLFKAALVTNSICSVNERTILNYKPRCKRRLLEDDIRYYFRMCPKELRKIVNIFEFEDFLNTKQEFWH
jgi:hypothetical protein